VDAERWRELLTRWNADLLQTPDLADRLPAEAVAAGWLGYPGATDEQLLRAETRLGASLPRSYREFLKVSNGWRHLGYFHWNLWSAEQIEWFRVRNQDWLDAYTEPWRRGGSPPVPDDEYFVYGDDQSDVAMRVEYLPSTLEVSDVGDSAILLLNPEVRFPNGEWEAWDFATWHPGANRYRSFWEMMRELYTSFLQLRANASGS
jgi:hypothetical protein